MFVAGLECPREERMSIRTPLLVAIATGAASVAAWIKYRQHPVVSGADVGFRIDQEGPGGPVGYLVVRRNGKWVRAESTAGHLQRWSRGA